MNFETMHSLERTGDLGKSLCELPSSHLEHIDVKALEGLTKREACEKIAGDYYDGLEEGAPGILNGFTEISGGAGKEVFQKAYSDYVNKPEQLKEKERPLYDFLRDRVFRGREYASDTTEKEAGQELSFGGGLGISEIKHIRGSSMISKAKSKYSSAATDESNARKARINGDTSKAASLESRARSLRSEAKSLEEKGKKLMSKRHAHQG